MEGKRRGYAWAVFAGICAALAAVSAKSFPSSLHWRWHFLKYGLVISCNMVMWGCHVNSLKLLSSLQATVTNFATNFLASGISGFILFREPLSSQWFLGAFLILLGVFVMSKSSIEKKVSSD
ncbi:uncharacterized protein LOC116248461 [Nymphaea colorata]|nr:uncharacterized protein LOC116248461 [Nymphaea colorata]